MKNKYNKINRILGNNVCLQKITTGEFRIKYHDCCFNFDKNISELNDKLNRSNDLIWSIENIKNQSLTGFLFVIDVDRENRVCEIVCLVNKKSLPNEHFNESLNYMINYLFTYTDFNEIVFKVDTDKMYFIDAMNNNNLMHINQEKHMKKFRNNEFTLIYSTKKTQFLGFNVNELNCNKINFTKFMEFYYEQLKKYKPKIDKINITLLNLIDNDLITKKTINKYCKLLNDRKKLLFEVVNNSLSHFNELKEEKITVYLTGSYARNSQRLFSDIDLNFMYENKFIKKNIIFEDLIAFLITNIFDIGYRDRVHPMGYLTLINSFPLKPSRYFATSFPTGDMVVSVGRHTCYDIMYENINMPRSPKHITDYISQNNCINYIREFIYNHEILFTNDSSDHILNVLRKDDFDIICNNSFDYYIKLLINNLANDIFEQKNRLKKKCLYIKEFKKEYKTLPSKALYSIFFLLRRLEMKKYNNTDVELIKISFEKLKLFGFSKNFIEKITFDYYNYIFKLNKVEYVFNCSNISLSSHTMEIMTIIENCYKEKHGKSLYEDIFQDLLVLYDDMLQILNFIKEKINETRYDSYVPSCKTSTKN